MIQQKKINTNQSQNYFSSFYPVPQNKKSLKQKPALNQSKRKSSHSQLSFAIDRSLNKEYHDSLQKFQSSKPKYQQLNKPTVSHKNATKQHKNKRKSIKPQNMNISSSAVILSQIKQNQNRTDSRQKRKSFTKLQTNELNLQFGKYFPEGEHKSTKDYRKQSKSHAEVKKLRQQMSRPSIYSLKKDKPSQRLQDYEKKKHLSCASLFEGKIQSKSKSKSKSKDKKGQKKKNSYKFNKINMANRQKQNKNRVNQIVSSIENEFKSITKKIQRELQSRQKKSTKSIKKDEKDFHFHPETKKPKVSNKENKDPTKKLSKIFSSLNGFGESVESNILIKKEPLHAHRKFSEKFDLNLKLNEKRKSKDGFDKSDVYFFIRKSDTPSSSRKQFPVNKYFEGQKPVQTHQSKRNSFQKTVKPYKKRSSINERQISSHRSSLKDRSIGHKYQVKIESDNKTKAKKSTKGKKDGNASCFYLIKDHMDRNELRRRSQSLSEQDLIYKQSGEQFRQAVNNYDKTPKNHEFNDDSKQTILRHKKRSSSIAQEYIPSGQKSKQSEINPAEGSQDTFLVYGSQSFNQSLNIDQIRYYERITPENYNLSANKKILETQQMETNLNEPKIFQKHFKNRSLITVELKEEYPLLSKKELQFLASICFIQRKWKQLTLARKIKELISLKNTSELFTKNKSTFFRQNLFPQDKNSSNFMTSGMISKSEMKNLTTQSQNTQTEEFVLETQQNVHQIFAKKQPIKLIQKEKIEQQQGEMIEKQETRESPKLSPFIKQEDIFPDTSYLKTKKYLLKRQLIEKLNFLKQDSLQQKLSHEEFQQKKKFLEKEYKEEVKKIRQTKHTIKKGYLKYVETLNTVNKSILKDNLSLKSSRKNGSSKMLSRVNSEEGFLGDIYRKIFKLQQISSDNGSQASGQTKRLNEIFLIRKSGPLNRAYNQGELRRYEGLGKNLGYDNGVWTDRLVQKLRTQEEQPKTKPLSSRQIKSMQLGQASSINQPQRQTILFDEGLELGLTDGSKKHTIPLVIERQSPKAYNITELISESGKDLSRLKSSPQKQVGYSEKMRITLPQERSIELKSERTEKSPQFGTPIEELEIQPQQQIEQARESYVKHPRQSFEIDQEDEIEDICFSLDHNHEEYNEQMPAYISPISSSMSFKYGANSEARDFLERFVQFLCSSNIWVTVICEGLNNPQGFSPFAYLRFVRSFELPDEDYTQIVPNEPFSEFEQETSKKQNLASNFQLRPQTLLMEDEPWHNYSLNQYKSVEHRCLFELLNSQLEAFRVYGEKGKPFPWQTNYTCYLPKEIPIQKVSQILHNCLQKCLTTVLTFSCGIILQNHPDIFNEEDLEELHDKNEDEIIDMIQSELIEEKHAWYELEEHTLQTRFELTEMIWADIINEVAKEIIKIRKPKTFSF